jgi:hypothetical protein
VTLRAELAWTHGDWLRSLGWRVKAYKFPVCEMLGPSSRSFLLRPQAAVTGERQPSHCAGRSPKD